MHSEPTRKPCIALMGEFSAGKSTLANLLIGYHPLPVQVVATRLPPVRISYGDEAPFSIDDGGKKTPVDLTDLNRLELSNTALIQIFGTEDLLRHCDLIDMPGISDPNVPEDAWERLIDEVDSVLWCSPATQAWRQSEAAVWEMWPDELYSRSLLLLTRMDKLTSDLDRSRVLQRVKQETAGLFADVLPLSLLLATEEHEDFDAWERSGAGELAKRLITLLHDIHRDLSISQVSEPIRMTAFEAASTKAEEGCEPHFANARITPRRVHLQAEKRIPRA